MSESVAKPGEAPIDVDALMEEIRQEVARERAAAPEGAVPLAPAPHAPSERPSWGPVRETLEAAEQNAAVGSAPPLFNTYHPLLRRPGRALARVILALAEVVTRPQRAYNIALVQSVRLLADRVRALEAENDALRARLGDSGGDAERR